MGKNHVIKYDSPKHGPGTLTTATSDQIRSLKNAGVKVEIVPTDTDRIERELGVRR
jgi:hypothetical protein